MFVSSACVGLYMKTCYPDEAKKSPVPCFPKGRGIRSCYHLMFPKRSHAPAHGVLIIKDPGISNGYQFRHSLLTFSGYLRSRFRCAAPGCIQKKKSTRLSSTGRSFPYLFPSSLFHYIPHDLTRLYGSLYGDSKALSRAEALKFVNFISFPAIPPDFFWTNNKNVIE